MYLKANVVFTNVTTVRMLFSRSVTVVYLLEWSVYIYNVCVFEFSVYMCHNCVLWCCLHM